MNAKGHFKTYVSLLDIVDEALGDLDEGSHFKEKFLMWGMRLYKRYRMDIKGNIKTVKREMTPWKSVLLPDDCVDWLAIGIPTGQELLTFVNDPKMLTRYCACDEDAPTKASYENEDMAGEGLQYFNWTELGEHTGKMFGMVAKDNGLGYFNPHPTDRVNEIQLSEKVKAGTKIVLMYLASLFDPRADAVVHPYCADFIRAGIILEYVRHKMRKGSRSASVMAYRDIKDEFDNALCDAVERMAHLSKEDILEAIRQPYSLAPKFA